MEFKNKINGGDEEEIKNKMNTKRSRSMHVISVVLFMLRRRRRRKPYNNSVWRRIVESFQKLKNDNITILPLTSNMIMPLSKEEAAASGVDGEVLTATPISSSSGISGYESAKSLRDMDCLGDDCYADDDDACYGDDDGDDEMIDVKAEEFIVRFYEQMRMQNQAYSNRYEAKEMITV